MYTWPMGQHIHIYIYVFDFVSWASCIMERNGGVSESGMEGERGRVRVRVGVRLHGRSCLQLAHDTKSNTYIYVCICVWRARVIYIELHGTFRSVMTFGYFHLVLVDVVVLMLLAQGRLAAV